MKESAKGLGVSDKEGQGEEGETKQKGLPSKLRIQPLMGSHKTSG